MLLSKGYYDYDYLPDDMGRKLRSQRLTRRNAISPLTLETQARLIAVSEAAERGEKLKGKKLRRRSRSDATSTQSRMMMVSPLGHGTTM